MFITHIVFAFLISLLTFKFFDDPFTFILFVVIGAILPDIDNPASRIGGSIKPLSNIIKKLFGHRGIFHSLFPLLLIFFLISKMNIAYALVIGYLSHIVIDGLTLEGVALFHPVSKFRLKGFVKVNSFMELVFFLLVFSFVVLKVKSLL